MSGEDGFLTRWSRRKQGARQQPAPVAAPAAVPEVEAPPAPEIDPETLPPVESLTAESSLAPFLQKGVPVAVKHAALRTMWAADPAIRDYVGPADFQWDFNAEGAITGFGRLDTGIDVGQMVADVTEYHLKPPPVEAPMAEAQVQMAEREAESGAEPMPAGPGEPIAEAMLAAELPPDLPEAAPLPLRRRRHGGATPV